MPAESSKPNPGWIVVAPPNYGPLQKSVRTMWDLMRDVAITAGMLRKPARPSFEHDIRPLFERLARLQWVNAGFAAGFGWGSPNDFTSPEWLEKLSHKTDDTAEMRHVIANQFRVFDRDSWSPVPWPWVYGDAMSIPPAETPRQNAALTDTQLGMLQQWAAGDFDADYIPGRTPPRRIGDVPLVDQPHMLDRASLEFCLADAFHPGLRDDLADAHRRGLYGPVSPRSCPAGLDRTGIWPGTGCRPDQSAERTVARGPVAWRNYPLDGGTVADRHGELPLRVLEIL